MLLVNHKILFTFSAKRAAEAFMFDDSDDEHDEMLELDAPQESLAPEVSPSTHVTGVGPIEV